MEKKTLGRWSIQFVALTSGLRHSSTFSFIKKRKRERGTAWIMIINRISFNKIVTITFITIHYFITILYKLYIIIIILSSMYIHTTPARVHTCRMNDTHSFKYKWYWESIETGRQQVVHVYVYADGHLSLYG